MNFQRKTDFIDELPTSKLSRRNYAHMIQKRRNFIVFRIEIKLDEIGESRILLGKLLVSTKANQVNEHLQSYWCRV